MSSQKLSIREQLEKVAREFEELPEWQTVVFGQKHIQIANDSIGYVMYMASQGSRGNPCSSTESTKSKSES